MGQVNNTCIVLEFLRFQEYR